MSLYIYDIASICFALHMNTAYIPCVPKAQRTFKPFHKTQKLISVLGEWQKPFFPEAFQTAVS